MNNKRIIAETLQQLEQEKCGRKDCIIYITYDCAREINKMPIWRYDELMEDLKIRNIELKDEV